MLNKKKRDKLATPDGSSRGATDEDPNKHGYNAQIKI
jgi:hypothetical protein